MPQLNVIAIISMVAVVASAIIAGLVFAPGNSNSSSVASSAGDNANSAPARTNMTSLNIA